MQNQSQPTNVVTFVQKRTPSSSESEKQKPTPKLTLEQFQKLSKRFEAIWEDRWTSKISQHGEDLISEWREELASFDEKVLQEAATKARSRFGWPPSIAEFSEICRAIKNGTSVPVVQKPNKFGSSDKTHQEWKNWFKIRFGVTPII